MDFSSTGILYIIATAWSLLTIALIYWAASLKSQNSFLKSQKQDQENSLQGLRSEIRTNNEKIASLNEESGRLNAQNADLKHRCLEDRQFFQENEERLSNQFKAIAGETLKGSNDSFLSLAESLLGRYKEDARGQAKLSHQELSGLISPIQSSLEKVDQKIQHLEKSREGAYQGLKGQVQQLLEAQSNWHQEATRLSQALLSPVSKGLWGEIQLKRVVELSGMVSYCDFFEQETEHSEEGQRLRPDMVIRLPGNRQIILDAKSPLTGYFGAIEEKSEELRIKKMKTHADLVRRQINTLSQKSYWTNFKPTPEFVILFMPGEHFYSAALQADPSLIDLGAEKKVIIATPTTLIALLKSIAYSWKHEDLAENAKEISVLGQEMYARICDYSGHIGDIGKSLKTAVDSYNKSVWSLESRVLVTAKKFQKLGINDSKKDLHEVPEVQVFPKELKGASMES